MYRNSRYLLKYNSYQIRHAETAWGILAAEVLVDLEEKCRTYRCLLNILTARKW